MPATDGLLAAILQAIYEGCAAGEVPQHDEHGAGSDFEGLAERIERAASPALGRAADAQCAAYRERDEARAALAELEAEVRLLVKLEPQHGPGYVWAVYGLGGLNVERVPRVAALLSADGPAMHPTHPRPTPEPSATLGGPQRPGGPS